MPSARYIVARRTVENLDSRFAAVIELYDKEPYVQAVERRTPDGPASSMPAPGLKVTLRDATDYILSGADTQPRR